VRLWGKLIVEILGPAQGLVLEVELEGMIIRPALGE
jgi:hypothetical protein